MLRTISSVQKFGESHCIRMPYMATSLQ